MVITASHEEHLFPENGWHQQGQTKLAPRRNKIYERPVRWMCGVSLKDRSCSVDLYTLLGVQSVADVVRHGRLKSFGNLEHKGVDDWVSA